LVISSGKDTIEIQGFNFIASHDINEPKNKFEGDDDVASFDYDEVPIRYGNFIINLSNNSICFN
jgi:hypothetical protein